VIKPETVIEFLWTEGLDEYAEAVKRLQQRVKELEEQRSNNERNLERRVAMALTAFGWLERGMTQEAAKCITEARSLDPLGLCAKLGDDDVLLAVPKWRQYE
jgi:hypothetical protein